MTLKINASSAILKFLLFNHRYLHHPSPGSLPDWEVVHSLSSRAAVRIGRCQAEHERLGDVCTYEGVLVQRRGAEPNGERPTIVELQFSGPSAL